MESWPKISVETAKEYKMCFGCGSRNPIGLKLKFDWDGKVARADFTPGENHQGWSNYVHGGIITCLLDEAVGWTALFAGFNTVTAKLNTRFRQMAVSGEPLVITCEITKNAKRLIETEARL